MQLTNKHHIAIKYFKATGLIPDNAKPYQYSLHHIDTDLKHSNMDRYNQWNVEDLIPLNSGYHTYIHDNKIADNREFQLELLNKRGQIDYDLLKEVSSYTPGREKDCVFTEEHKQAVKEGVIATYKNGRKGSALGKHWYNNGITERYDFECPEGYVKGRLKGVLNNANNARLKRYAEQSQIESD